MIYFDKGRSIWGVRPNGKELRMISRGIDAHISPDGKRIYCKCGKHGGLGVMKPDGSHLRSIGGGHQDFGSAYLYLSGVGTFVTAGSEQGDIGGSSILVGDDSAESEAELHAVYTAHEGSVVDVPFFSPDGSKILFLEWEQTTLTARVNVINSDGSGLHTVFENPGIVLPGHSPINFNEGIEGLAGFSADGRTALIYGNETTSGANIWTAATDGGLERELNPLPRNGYEARLSENGERIAFTSHPLYSQQATGLFTIGIDGSGLRKIAPAGPGEEVTSWGKVALSAASKSK